MGGNSFPKSRSFERVRCLRRSRTGCLPRALEGTQDTLCRGRIRPAVRGDIQAVRTEIQAVQRAGIQAVVAYGWWGGAADEAPSFGGAYSNHAAWVPADRGDLVISAGRRRCFEGYRRSRRRQPSRPREGSVRSFRAYGAAGLLALSGLAGVFDGPARRLVRLLARDDP